LLIDLSKMREMLSEGGVALRSGDAADQKLMELRRWYEPYVVSKNSNNHVLMVRQLCKQLTIGSKKLTSPGTIAAENLL
jgi:hypothetical protein